MTRFSEKSFEVRFCAALSAAIMPFNRNPQWLGLTQAQERKHGVDTLIRIGGRLFMFQFKAKHHDAFRISKYQWTCLSPLAAAYPQSVYYVFPEAQSIRAAASVSCILKHSWCVPAAAMGPIFKKGTHSSVVWLDPAIEALVRHRPYRLVSSNSACEEFGCFCPTPNGAVVYEPRSDDQPVLSFAVDGIQGDRLSGFGMISERRDAGILLGGPAARVGQARRVESVDQFEEMLGDGRKQDLAPGLFGLFLPL